MPAVISQQTLARNVSMDKNLILGGLFLTDSLSKPRICFIPPSVQAAMNHPLQICVPLGCKTANLGRKPHLNTETLGLDKRQRDLGIILPGFADEVHVLTEVFLEMFLCGWEHHRGFDL